MVAERAAEQDQRRERERVRRDRPLQRVEADAQVAADRRQRDVDDGRVEPTSPDPRIVASSTQRAVAVPYRIGSSVPGSGPRPALSRSSAAPAPGVGRPPAGDGDGLAARWLVSSDAAAVLPVRIGGVPGQAGHARGREPRALVGSVLQLPPGDLRVRTCPRPRASRASGRRRGPAPPAAVLRPGQMDQPHGSTTAPAPSSSSAQVEVVLRRRSSCRTNNGNPPAPSLIQASLSGGLPPATSRSSSGRSGRPARRAPPGLLGLLLIERSRSTIIELNLFSVPSNTCARRRTVDPQRLPVDLPGHAGAREQPRTCASVPHGSSGYANGGGGGRSPLARKSGPPTPRRPHAMPRPPGPHPPQLAAATSCRGANAPRRRQHDVEARRPRTADSSASPSPHSTLTPPPDAPTADLDSSGVMSTRVTPAACAARTATFPLPRATSSTSSPTPMPTGRTILWPTPHSAVVHLGVVPAGPGRRVASFISASPSGSVTVVAAPHVRVSVARRPSARGTWRRVRRSPHLSRPVTEQVWSGRAGSGRVGQGRGTVGRTRSSRSARAGSRTAWHGAAGDADLGVDVLDVVGHGLRRLTTSSRAICWLDCPAPPARAPRPRVR